MTSQPVIVVAGQHARSLTLERSMLNLHNPRFVMTDDGNEALQLVIDQRPKLVVLSEDLAGISGSEVARRVREHEELRPTSLMLLDAAGGLAHPANVPSEDEEELDREALVMLADRLLSISPRTDTRASVCIGRTASGKSEALYAQSVNISESGMLLTCGEPLLVGEEIQLHFVLPGMPDLVRAQARVVRQDPRAIGEDEGVYGVEFTRLLPRYQLLVRRYMRTPRS